MRIRIPVLITDNGDGSVGLSVFQTEEQRNRYMEQEKIIAGYVYDEGDRTIEIDVNEDGTWSPVRRYEWEDTIEEELAKRDQEIAEDNS